MNATVAMTGKELSSLMRKNGVTIREMKRRTGFTLKLIREYRESGIPSKSAARDWIQAITGTDPGEL